MESLKHGSIEVRKHGKMEAWKHGNIKTWKHGIRESQGITSNHMESHGITCITCCTWKHGSMKAWNQME